MNYKSILLVVQLSIFILAAEVFAQNNSTVDLDETRLFASANSETSNFIRAELSQNADASEQSVPYYALEKQTFELINRQREINGLAPLAWSDEASRVARLHSENMAKGDFFSHKGLDGRTLYDRAESTGLKFWYAIGENLAYNYGYTDPSKIAVADWMKSSGHRSNILNKGWKEAGIGIAVASNNGYYFTQVFLMR